jgi:hypothetical protein
LLEFRVQSRPRYMFGKVGRHCLYRNMESWWHECARARLGV